MSSRGNFRFVRPPNLVPSSAMDTNALVDGLILFLCFIPIVTVHEFAHAWVASRCGDNTARDQGRVTLDPAAHIDPIGTIAIPLLVVFVGAVGSNLGGLLIGWGRSVPVNLSNLRRRRLDDTMIALAGPAMNVIFAFVVLAAARLTLLPGWLNLTEMGLRLASLSLFLCFFNLLPVPPLDGSHVARNFIGMKDETYLRLCQFGFLAVIIIVQIPQVMGVVYFATFGTYAFMRAIFGL